MFDYIHPSPRPAAPTNQASHPANLTSPLACTAAPGNDSGPLEVAGGAALVASAVVVIELCGGGGDVLEGAGVLLSSGVDDSGAGDDGEETSELLGCGEGEGEGEGVGLGVGVGVGEGVLEGAGVLEGGASDSVSVCTWLSAAGIWFVVVEPAADCVST
ncbi:hypothetical protein BU26DRAFT_283960 [Trematosphaeria pertusa]|uniref:Uncharacterized protein n=1 Tax=Trematosphaeria pertusa TaxID=390896 RepID=A0A6A6INT2_9PLEO|nr:uncharacterized protein BU26DRAFT_283960 [Trematosphaeria pertusa]KAF2251482.1 hypothetical protein BU26DRAFT_283960 [Trematosphaeria pertusa]